jgi:redox-sensitive bicupin YhaK (pirin superfamily)
MAGEDRRSLIDLADAQRGEDGTVVMIGACLPVGAPGREQEAGAGGMEIVDRRQQARHGTGRDDQAVEAPIRLLPGTNIRRVVAGAGGFLGLVEDGARQMRAGMAQGEHLQRRTHLGDLADLSQIEGGDADATARLADGEPLRLQPLESLPHRDMASAELGRDMVLPQARTRLELSGNDPLGEDPADADRQGLGSLSSHELSIISSTASVESVRPAVPLPCTASGASLPSSQEDIAMSQLPDHDPIAGDTRSCEALEQVIVPRAHDLGGFSVRRALPSIGRKMVGPFIFFDQMGPAEFLLGEGIDVRPHPHIGLSTVTYLFDGEIMHRDSLGTALPIRPGAVNLMTAGRGIVHSERTAPEERLKAPKLYGIQTWLALPKTHEEVAPEFIHHAAPELPRIVGEGKRVSLIMGSAFGESSPVKFPWDTLYAEAVLAPGAILPLDPDYHERAVYIVTGKIDIAGDEFGAGQLLIFKPGDRISILAVDQSRLMLIGGEPMDGPRHIWWNFVSSSKERIDQAKQEWKTGRFDTVPGDEEEFIPLPEG